jgi:prepilin-type N-terminal cleavage/methylation domain-containing protein
VTSGDGFSLIELAIVLVILGLLVVGIMLGQSLICAPELRDIPRELQGYQPAATTLCDKYSDIPGDMTDAAAAAYNLTNNSAVCALIFKAGF